MCIITAGLGLKAVKKVTLGDFEVPSQVARDAVEIATQLLAWTNESDANLKMFTAFFCDLATRFKRCFGRKGSMKLREEAMWREYHSMRVKDSFREDWKKFLQESIGREASPTFFQYVTHELFKELVKARHELPQGEEEQAEEEQADNISLEDENALRYVSGYVCRKVQVQLKSSSLPNKDDMILFISDLSGDEWDETQGTEEWINSIDRGGLWHVNDNTYLIFYLMEEVIRKHLTVQAAKTLKETTRKEVLDAVLSNEDILFQWSLLTTAIGDEVGGPLLNKIAELYFTVRGFHFASSILELFKQAHKKRTQKSKALRKKLITD